MFFLSFRNGLIGMELIYGYYRGFSDNFWSEDVWLPPNTTWADLYPDLNSEIRHTDYRHLFYPIPAAFIMILIRFVAEYYWLAPMGRILGIKNSSITKPIPNKMLEKSYLKHQNSLQIFLLLGKKLDMSERQIARWLKKRRKQDQPSTIVKFCENSWKCLFYTFSFLFGLYVLWNKPWFWDINECWYRYPHQGITTDIWFYYMIALTYSWSQCISQFTDVPHKDFWQMFIHHIVTIALLWFSWICNVHRIGSLVLIVHDSADVLLQLFKILKYVGWQVSCARVYYLFTVVWIITRLGIFPFWIIRSTSIEAPKIVPMFPAYYIFNTLFLLLLTLHVIWTGVILKVAYRTFQGGIMERDLRSASEESDDDGESA